MGAEVTRAIVIGAAPCPDWRFLDAYRDRPVLTICADGGRVNAQRAGLKPDWYVGDSDSGGSPEGLPSVTLPPEKDVTDLEMAVELAFRQGCTDLILCGCTGGRLDHFLGGVHLLEQMDRRGGTGCLADPENEIRFVRPGVHRLARDDRFRYVSLLPLDEALRGVTLEGAKYPLRDAEVLRWTTLGISNECAAEVFTLTLREGRGLLIRSGTNGQGGA